MYTSDASNYFLHPFVDNPVCFVSFSLFVFRHQVFNTRLICPGFHCKSLLFSSSLLILIALNAYYQTTVHHNYYYWTDWIFIWNWHLVRTIRKRWSFFSFKFNFDVTPLYIHCLILPSWGFCFYFGFKTLFCLFIGTLNNNSLVSLHSHYFRPNIILLYYLKYISVAPCIHFWLLNNDRNIFKFYFCFSSPLNFLFQSLVNEKFNQKLVRLQVIKLNRGCWLFYNTCALCILSAIHRADTNTHTHT